MRPIRICIVDEHALIRLGLRALLGTENGWQIVGEATTADDAQALLSTLRPEVLLVDLTVFATPPNKAVPALQEKSPLTKIVALTLQEDLESAQEVLQAGAVAYLTKSAADAELLAALRGVIEGRTIVNLRSDARPHAPPTPKVVGRLSTGVLSEREREVLRFVARGFTSAEISAKLYLSVKTIETYRSRMMTKLQLRSRAELMEFVSEQSIAD